MFIDVASKKFSRNSLKTRYMISFQEVHGLCIQTTCEVTLCSHDDWASLIDHILHFSGLFCSVY